RSEYLEAMAAGAQGEFYIEAHRVEEELSDEKKLVETFDFEIEGLQGGETVYFNPFLVPFYKTNPFKAEKRNHPVDFGYPRHFTYMAKIKLPPGYGVKELPESVTLGLPEQSGSLRVNYSQGGDAIMIVFNLQLKFTQYTNRGYPYLKEIFETAVNIQNKN